MELEARVGHLEARVEVVEDYASGARLERRLDAIEQRMAAVSDKADAHRDRISSDIHTLTTSVALGEQSHKAISTKIDALSTDVKFLMNSATKTEGKTQAWAPFVDLVFKVLAAVGIAYIAYYLKIK